MITKLKVENFRSIESAEIDLGRINVLTGSNNSGKSSFIYALMGMKNFISNPNQSLDSFFNFPNLINLGGFQEVVFNKNKEQKIALSITINNWLLENNDTVEYKIELNPSKSTIRLISKEPYNLDIDLDITLPYTGGRNTKVVIEDVESKPDSMLNYPTINFSWTGLFGVFESSDLPIKIENTYREQLSSILNLPQNTLVRIDNLPLRRQFLKPFYSNISLQPDIMTEDEIATKIAIDSDLEENISHYLEKIIGKRFKVNKQLGTSVFRLETFDKKTRFNNDVVNDGLGTNQILFILFKALQKDKSFICIDEPEIHLHPSIITKLVDTLIEIAYEENKQFLISTHNEHLMSCLLASVSDKKLKANDLKVYYLTKNGKKTEVESQEVNENGQISGGLKNFYEAELENLAKLFNIVEP